MMKRMLIGLAAAAALVLGSAAPAMAAPGGGGRMSCEVAPVSAAAVNAGGTWSYELFNAEPNVAYNVQVTFATDPSNGGHPNTSITTDANGYGIATLPAWWAVDGFLPGSMVNGQFVAQPGEFVVRIGPKAYVFPEGVAIRAGKTTCYGVVSE